VYHKGAGATGRPVALAPIGSGLAHVEYAGSRRDQDSLFFLTAPSFGGPEGPRPEDDGDAVFGTFRCRRLWKIGERCNASLGTYAYLAYGVCIVCVCVCMCVCVCVCVGARAQRTARRYGAHADIRV